MNSQKLMKLCVNDAWCGASPDACRVVCKIAEVARQAHFVKHQAQQQTARDIRA